MNSEALEIIENSRVLHLATIDVDGSPRSTIITGYVADGEIVWRSSPETTHSKNIARTHVIGVSAFYDDPQTGAPKAVYISTTAQSTGTETYDERIKANVVEYRAVLGEYDAGYSKPNRLYFKESRS